MHHDIRVENDGGEVMPFAFGYHPAFLCPFDAAHKAGDYVLRFDTPQTPTVIETGEVTTATRSSMTRIPKTMPVNFCWRSPMSLKALNQIFDGVDTLQEMELSPLSEGESSLVQEQIREITGQSL